MVVWYLHLETNRELKGLLKPERLCGGAPLPGINAAPPRRLLETKGVNGLSADRMRMKPKRNRLMLRTRFAGWKDKASRLKLEIYAIYLAYKDPRVPWYARVFAACVVGYAFSPIDLIPDPIPVLGYLDDLLLVPLGIALAIKMIPADVLRECREKAFALSATGAKKPNRIAALLIVSIWIALFVWTILYLKSWW